MDFYLTTFVSISTLSISISISIPIHISVSIYTLLPFEFAPFILRPVIVFVQLFFRKQGNHVGNEKMDLQRHQLVLRVGGVGGELGGGRKRGGVAEVEFEFGFGIGA